MGKTPFLILYGSKVVIQLEVLYPTLKVGVNSNENEESRSTNLVSLEEKKGKGKDKNGGTKKKRLKNF